MPDQSFSLARIGDCGEGQPAVKNERGIAQGTIKLIAMLESPTALLLAREIATASPRMAGLTLGMEDYTTAMGTTPNLDLLRPAFY